MVAAQPTDIPVMTRSQSLFILSVRGDVEVCDDLLLVVHGCVRGGGVRLKFVKIPESSSERLN